MQSQLPWSVLTARLTQHMCFRTLLFYPQYAIERNLQGARAASFVALRATLTIRVASLILLTVCRLDEIFQGVCGGCLFSGICDWRVPTLDRGKDQRKHHGDEEEAFRRTKLDDHRPKIYKRPPVS